MQFRTTEAYISGAVYGHMWWPQSLGGKPVRADMRGPWGCYKDGWSLADAVDSLLIREGGDFQDAAFTADSELVIVRKAFDAPGKYRVHVRTIPLATISPEHVGEMETCEIMSEWED